MIFEAVWRLSA